MNSLISKIITPPKSKYTNYYKKARYDITWNMFLFLTIGLLPTTIVYYFFDYRAFYPSLYAFFTCLIQVIWFYKKRNYKVNGFIFVFHGVLFLGVELVLKTDTVHLIEFPWLVVFSLYGLLVLGKKIGILLISISVLFIAYYLMFCFKDNMLIVLTYITSLHLLAVFFNVVIAMVVMAFIIVEFKRSHKYAEKQYQIANDSILKQSELIQAQNEEKTIMLKEIHHRVKNNLQVVSSLVRLQSFETDDVKAKKMFDATVNRVVAMALIHEKMYQKDNLSKINLADYLESLAQDILESQKKRKSVSIKINSELEIIGNRTIVPLALIFNELISNSLEHAFEKIEKGELKVDIKIFDSDYFIIKYKDNGIWKNSSKETSFGIELITTFVDQLDGEVNRVSDENGTTYTFKLKNIE